MLSEASEIISLPELPNPAYSNATRYKAVTPRPWGLGPRGNTTAAGWETSPSLTSTELPQAWEAPSAGWASGDLPRASDETSATSNSRKPPPRPRWGRHRPVSRGIWGGQLSDERRVNAKKCILFFRPLQPPIEFNFSALRRYHRAADPSGGRLAENWPAGPRPGCPRAELCRDGRTDAGQPNLQRCLQSPPEDPAE